MNFYEQFMHSNKNREDYELELSSKFSVEARNILKDTQLRINKKSESLFTNSFGENIILFSLESTPERSMQLFKDINLRKGGILVPRLKNFYTPRNLMLKLPGRNIIKVFNKNQELAKVSKGYGVNALLVNQNLLTNFSTMYDLSNELETIKLATVGKTPNSLNPKMRQAILDFIKNRITSFPANDKVKYTNKVVIVPGPFFKGTNIKLIMMNKDLINNFRPFLLIMEWIVNDIDGFKKFLKDNNVTFMFKGIDNKTLFLSPNEKIINHRMFNHVFIMKILHILDGSKDKELISLSDEDKQFIGDVVEDNFKDNNKDQTEVLTNEEVVMDKGKITTEFVNDNIEDILEANEETNKDEEILFDESDSITEEELMEQEKLINEITPTDNPELESEIVSKTESDILEIEEMTADNLGVDFIINRNSHHKSFDEILNDADLSETEKVNEIMEIHNFSNLKRSIETPEVRKTKEKLMKSYGRKVEDVVADIKRHKIPTTNFKNVQPSVYAKNAFVNYEKTYNEVVGKSDFEGILTTPMMSSSSPMFLVDYKEEPINDREFMGKTLHLTYKDVNGNEHKVTLDCPLSINGKLFMGGSFKQLNLQDAAKPVVKTDEDVIITTAYNKTFLSLKGTYGSKESKQIVLTLDEYTKNGGVGYVSKTTTELGEFIYKNLVSYELIHLNRYYNKFLLKGTHIDFRGIREENGRTILGHIGDRLVYHHPELNKYWLTMIDKNGNQVESICNSLMEFLTKMTFEALKTLEDKEERDKSLNLFYKLFEKMSRRKVTTSKINSVYAKVMSRDIPVIFLMLTAMPLNDLLEKLKEENNLEYKIVKGNIQKLDILNSKPGTAVLRFANETSLVVKYNNTLNEIILSPLMDLDLSGEEIFNITNIVNDLMGSNTTIIYIENFVDFFVADPTIKRVLAMYNMPQDFVGLLIYACSLFTTHKTNYKSDSNNYRVITTSEVINRCLYDVLSKAMSDNAARVKMGSRARVVVPRDALVRRIQELPNLSEYSLLNPFRAIMEDRKKSVKGHLGTNQSRAFGTTLRMFNENNIGTETAATPYSGEAGVTKTLPMSPSIDSITGEYKHLSIEEAYQDPSKVLSMIESYVPYLYYDHIIRGMMADNQFAHAVAVKNADPMYVSYGADEAALYQCNGFSYVAEEDGEILAVTDTYTKIKYKSGKIDIIPMNEDERNADKGYFVPNKMKIHDSLAVGKKFKSGDVIAYNERSFLKKSNGRIGLGAGPVAMIVICDGEGTWEDSCIPFDDLSEKLTSNITKRVARVLDLNTEIRDFNTEINSIVNADDVLFKYRVLEVDDVISSFFTMDESLSMSEVTAHNHGILKDIRVYYRNSRDVNMSESIKKFIKEVTLKQRQHNNTDLLKDVTDEFRKIKYQKEPLELTRGSSSKVNGDLVENGKILIEYYIESEFKLGSGDKIVVDRALKGEPADVYPNELRPVGALSGKKGSLLFNTYGLLARITPGMILHGSLITILQHIAIKNRMILNRPPEPDSMLDYKSSMDMVEGKYSYKGEK